MAKFRIEDFSGGITEQIFNAAPNEAAIMDNFVITSEGRMKVRNGSVLYDTDYPQIPAGEQRISSIFKHSDTIFIHSGNKLYYDTGSAWQVLQGPTGGDAFTNLTTTDNISYSEWNGHMFLTSDKFDSPIKIYKDSLGNWQLRTAGLPKMTSGGTITPDSNDSKNYLYKMLYYYTYTVGDLTFDDYGATVLKEVTNGSDFSGIGHYHSITALPILSGSNYDVSNIKIKIYRTENNGDVFYYVGQVTNGTTTYQDTVTDLILSTRETLYTEGGVYENDAPPKSKYIIIANDIAWYLGTETYDYQVYQSIQGDLDSVPASFTVDLKDKIIGGGTLKNKPIIMTESKIYRLDGFTDLLGREGVYSEIIHDNAGCLNNSSIVQTPVGLFWCGVTGIYFTDGYQVSNISHHIKNIYKSYTNADYKKSKIKGAYDPIEEVIYWSLAAESTENDKILILNLRASSLPSKGSFTTISGNDSFKPTAIMFNDGELIRGSDLGYIFKHVLTSYTDPMIDTSISVNEWNREAIQYNWKHIAFDFGEPDMNKWVSKVTVGGQNESNVHLQLNSFDDGASVAKSLKEVAFLNDLTWQSPQWIWNNHKTAWNEQLLYSKTRWMLKNKLRTRYKQLQIVNALSTLDQSDTSVLANVSSATQRITLVATTSRFWRDSVGYEIRYSSDNGSTYSEWFKIVDCIDDFTLELEAGAIPVDKSNVKWEMRGYSMLERAHINSITYSYEVLSDRQNSGYYKSSEGSGNS